MNYNVKRAAGGHLRHAVRVGSFAALCGFEPGKGAVQRCMVDRSGWRFVRHGFGVSCRKCKAALEELAK